jgi:hypothetical protein
MPPLNIQWCEYPECDEEADEETSCCGLSYCRDHYDELVENRECGYIDSDTGKDCYYFAIDMCDDCWRNERGCGHEG